jgi:hypothetical protein
LLFALRSNANNKKITQKQPGLDIYELLTPGLFHSFAFFVTVIFI